MFFYLIFTLACAVIAFGCTHSVGMAIMGGFMGSLLGALIMVVYRGIQERT